MPYAISIRSDNESANQIRELWRDAGKLDQEPSMESLNYLPHLTLAIYDEIDSSLVIDAVAHSSLATSIAFERKTEALEFTNRSIEPIDVVFDVSDCASFLPVEVLHEIVLATCH